MRFNTGGGSNVVVSVNQVPKQVGMGGQDNGSEVRTKGRICGWKSKSGPEAGTAIISSHMGWKSELGVEARMMLAC